MAFKVSQRERKDHGLGLAPFFSSPISSTRPNERQGVAVVRNPAKQDDPKQEKPRSTHARFDGTKTRSIHPRCIFSQRNQYKSCPVALRRLLVLAPFWKCGEPMRGCQWKPCPPRTEIYCTDSKSNKNRVESSQIIAVNCAVRPLYEAWKNESFLK